MSQATPESPDAEFRRRIAMRCNNRAWSLAEQTGRTPAEDREMLDCAHTSAWHWAQIGTELHRMRSTMLLAQVHALLGHGSTALAMADAMRAYFLANQETPDWELAFTHAIHAQCAHAAGDAQAHRASYQQARAALDAIADKEDREIVERTFNNVPAP